MLCFAAGEANVNGHANSNVTCNNIIFTIKDTRLFASVVGLSARDN